MTYSPFIPRDYKNVERRNGFKRHIGLRAVLAVTGVLVLAGAWALWPADNTASMPAKAAHAKIKNNQPAAPETRPVPAQELVREDRPADSTADPPKLYEIGTDKPQAVKPGPAPVLDWQSVTVKAGDTLASIFSRHGLGPVAVHSVVYLDENTANLRDLVPGETIALALNADGNLAGVKFELDEVKLVKVVREQEALVSKVIERPLSYEVATAEGEIKNSLYLAGLKAGLSDALIMKLARIYAWDIDFVYDIRRGDRFFFIYEKVYRDGEYLRSGNILAAAFINRGEPIRAIRFVSSDGTVGYYTPDGRNMRKEFLRTPVDFRRISSRFNPNRMHPTLGYRRPHEGVDYAADSGTPVIATGDGRVTRASRWGGYGNCIIIKHAGSFETLYAHLSSYARGVREGARVEQGQIIGYVGMSGTATGPHLHYEFHINGQVHDPLKVKFPPAPPLPESEMARFKDHAQPLLARLDDMGAGPTMLARKDS